MSDVFVSYKAEDRKRVRPLVEALEADGYSVWWDEQIGGGAAWRQAIEAELNSAQCVIVAWSKRSVGPEGTFVQDEATRAQQRRVYVPVTIDKVHVPLGFGEMQALTLTGWKGDRSDPHYQAVLSAVRRIAGEGAAPTPHPIGRTAVTRRAVVGGAAVAAAAIAGGGAWMLLKPGSGGSDSIAVLPFANLSGDSSQAYFSDGIAEEIRTALSRIGQLRVVARTSSEMVREADAMTAARRLGVSNILTGSVRRSPAMVRIAAQLIDGDDGLERWSETFDRPAGDLLEIQTSIAQHVAQALSIRLAGSDHDLLMLGGTRNPEALDLYLRSNPEELNDSETGLQEALRLLDQAIALDPNFAQAHARKAFALLFAAGVYSLSSAEAQKGYGQAMVSANRAIAIAPQLASGYANRAAIFRDQLNMGKALREFQRADALPGDDAHTLRLYALALGQDRRFDEAQSKIERAKSLDPLNPTSLEVEGILLFSAGKYAEAAAVARRSIQLAPERVQVRRVVANSLLMLDKTSEAQAEYAKLEETDYRRLLGEAVLAARAGDRDKAIEKLRAMEQRYGDAAHYQYAEIYAQLGMVDKGMSALRLALETRDPGMAFVRVDPFLDPLRNDPRFAAIVARLNFLA